MPRVSSSLEEALSCLKEGKPVVVPTDTIYGIVADATNYRAVQLLKRIRRPSGRPFVVLIPDPSWAGKLGLVVDKRVLRLLSIPGLTLVLEKRGGLFWWLGRESIAVRYPRRGFIYQLLKKFARPLVAPSANPEGKPPARSIREAIKYFGEKVEVYVDGGFIENSPSSIVKPSEHRIIRRGRLSYESINRIMGGVKGW